ncbi:serine hydrolase domain-containing protein [Streptomyces sp900105755]|uniref:serine hydrolase domain-containing protein n=1 Tax=unclassified Streptomyces TaxID=2593676 RepID=UPI000894FCC4|nr:serine hydrolase domain-containing protein [Streptomyces sp. Ag109_O5-10]SEF06881.1 CubicO group peptidase, beta-lactamase class C family [Streptomyces sp. Ag109_O5-10]
MTVSPLHAALRRHVEAGTVPGAVGLVARGDDVEVVTVGHTDVEGSAPMARDSVFRIASVTKPITAAAVLMLVDEGRIGLGDPVADWLPELAKPMVVRSPASPVDDVVPAARQITVEDLLSFRAGWGLPDDFSLPAAQALFTVQDHGIPFRDWPDPDTWLGLLAQVPMLHQPGEAWLYGTASALQGILVARVSGRTLPDFLAERIFEPLGMRDTAFEVPASKRHRFTSAYAPAADGTLSLTDTPDGAYSSLPRFPSGGGGLVSTADDWLAFARLLLNAGTAPDGRRLLTATSVSRMTTNHLTAAQRERAALFLEGQGWGYGGSVDVAPAEPWSVPGRYGWVGGTGTTAHLVPATGTVTVLLTQTAMTGPTTTSLMRDFWRATA